MTIDTDVATRLEALRSKQGLPFKQIVNDVLRAGLNQYDQPTPRKPGPFTHPQHHGGALISDIDDISEVLAIVEGENYK